MLTCTSQQLLKTSVKLIAVEKSSQREDENVQGI